ncbi:MAG: GntR family transcriptional regulator, partial [Pirellulales bacterium]|nr:GntR family transcriptional regulator [Pirellulales bacterium]
EIFDTQRSKPHLLTAEVAKYTCEGKSRLIEALRQRDSRRARELMSKQIQRGRKQILRNLK